MLDDKVFQFAPNAKEVGYVGEYKYAKAKVVMQGGKLFISLPSGQRFKKPKPQKTLDHPKEILRRAADCWETTNTVKEIPSEPEVPLPPVPPPPAGSTNLKPTRPLKKIKVGDKPKVKTSELNLDQANVFRYPTTEADRRQLKLIADALDLSFKSSGQEAISPDLHRPDDCVNAIKEAEKLLSSRRYQTRKYDFHQGLMHFMLSREVVLGPRGKQYFRDKVKNYKSVRPAQLFNEAYGWYDKDGLLEEEIRTLEQIKEEINSEEVEVERDSSTSSSSDTESSSDSDSN